jgi:hypothetical protein
MTPLVTLEPPAAHTSGKVDAKLWTVRSMLHRIFTTRS